MLDRWEQWLQTKQKGINKNIKEPDRVFTLEKRKKVPFDPNYSQGKSTREIFLSAKQTWFDLITDLSQGSLPPEERQFFLNILRSRGILIDKSREIAEFFPKLEMALLNLYGKKIGRQRIKYFFDNFKQDEIIVARTEEVAKVGQDLVFKGNLLRRRREEERKKQGEVAIIPNRAGFNCELRGIVMIGCTDDWSNPNAEIDFEVTLAEEIVHIILGGGLNKKGIIKLMKNTKKLVNAIRGYEVYNYSMYYYDSPDEQVAKSVTLNLFHEIRPEIHPSVIYEPLSLRAAKMGSLRARELGWSNILKGNLRTNHEDDFLVRTF